MTVRDKEVVIEHTDPFYRFAILLTDTYSRTQHCLHCW